jgi:hypothetical protein
MSSDIRPIMQELTEKLCGRRALGPLKHLLEGWPLIMATSDEWHSLWSALRNLRGAAVHTLTVEERALVDEAYRLVDSSIRAAGQEPGGPSA